MLFYYLNICDKHISLRQKHYFASSIILKMSQPPSLNKMASHNLVSNMFALVDK